jgi:hypothetical protein
VLSQTFRENGRRIEFIFDQQDPHCLNRSVRSRCACQAAEGARL